jgi:heme A synthase
LELRILHGSFAQIVLAVLVSVAVFTSPSWIAGTTCAESSRLRRSARWALALVYLQIVLGVLLRHTYGTLAQRLHLLTAFAALAAVIWLVKVIWEQRDRTLRVSAIFLICAVSVQLLLGVEAWMTQLGAGTMPEMLPITTRRVGIRTAHVLGGSLLLAATVTTVLLTHRATTAIGEQPEAAA